jgi:Uncharacterized conserved protein
MITKNTLMEMARTTGLSLYQQEKHYFLTLILRSISSRFGQNLVFKGGTCLFFFYGLRRFSEDLDFTSYSHLDTRKILPGVLRDLELRGVEATHRITMDNDISYSIRFGIKGPLFENEKYRNYVKIKISKREKPLLAPNFLYTDPIYTEILPFNVLVMNVDEILSEKIRVTITRNQARDVFDLWFLLRSPVSSKFHDRLVNSKLSFYEKNSM